MPNSFLKGFQGKGKCANYFSSYESKFLRAATGYSLVGCSLEFRLGYSAELSSVLIKRAVVNDEYLHQAFALKWDRPVPVRTW